MYHRFIRSRLSVLLTLHPFSKMESHPRALFGGAQRMYYFCYRRHRLITIFGNVIVVAAIVTALIGYRFAVSPSPAPNNFQKMHIPSNMVPVFHSQDNMQDLKCKIPVFDPWDPSLKDVVHFPTDKDTFECHWNQSHVVTLSYEGYLTVSDDEPDANCSYRCIHRAEKNDFDLVYSSWLKFDATSVTKPNCEHIEVECSQNKGKPFRKFFGQVVPTKLKEPKIKTTPADKFYSVITIIMDSSSQLNFYRLMPKTLKVLNETFGAQIFTSFTKTADSSFANGQSFLAGRPYENLTHTEIFEEYLDNPRWNWTWNWFSDLGYKTFFSEDVACCDFISYMKKGFIKKPYDHMYRPLVKACDSDPECIKAGLCYAGEKKHVRQFNHLHQFLNKYDRSVPKWALLWNTEVAHNYVSRLAYADKDLAQFLLDNQEQLKESFLVVMGDHGQRHTAIRQTVIGHFEDKMPFFSLSVPHSLKRRYPVIKENMKANSRILACFYDAYVTIQDIYLGQMYGWHNLGQPLGSDVKRPFPRSNSLMRPLSPDRSCFDIGVQEHYCSCIQSVQLDNKSPLSINLATHLLEFVNHMFDERPECAKLKLKTIIRSERLTIDYKLLEYKVIDIMYLKTGRARDETLQKYQLTIEAAPSDALFEGTLNFDGKNFKVVPPVDRINTYGNQSSCITDHYQLRRYCYCTTFNQTLLTNQI